MRGRHNEVPQVLRLLSLAVLESFPRLCSHSPAAVEGPRYSGPGTWVLFIVGGMWQPSSDALATELEHELVLLHAVTGEMFSLNASGRAVWQALPATLEQAAASLSELGASPAAAQADARALLAALARAGLVMTTDQESCMMSEPHP